MGQNPHAVSAPLSRPSTVTSDLRPGKREMQGQNPSAIPVPFPPLAVPSNLEPSGQVRPLDLPPSCQTRLFSEGLTIMFHLTIGSLSNSHPFPPHLVSSLLFFDISKQLTSIIQLVNNTDLISPGHSMKR